MNGCPTPPETRSFQRALRENPSLKSSTSIAYRARGNARASPAVRPSGCKTQVRVNLRPHAAHSPRSGPGWDHPPPLTRRAF